MRSTLEQHKAFPVIAWVTFIFFAGFTIYLALELQETAAYLGDRMDQNVEALQGVSE